MRPVQAHHAPAVRERLAGLNPLDADAARRMTENALLAAVRRDCKQLGLLAYHTHNSLHSEPGFPDLVIAGAGRLLFRELKKETGAVTPAQQQWLDALAAAGQDAAVWRPTDLVSGRVVHQLHALTRSARKETSRV